MIDLRAFIRRLDELDALTPDQRMELEDEAGEIERRLTKLEDRNRELLAALCGVIYRTATAELGLSLGGGSVLDLCADNIPGVKLPELKEAIKRAGITAG